MHPSLKLVAAGYLIHMAIESLTQDLMGKARCLRSMEANWTTGWVTVPFALFALVVAVVWIHGNLRQVIQIEIRLGPGKEG